MEHLEGVINQPEAEMSPQELQLHYFKMHDYDGNSLLDGLELSTAITHVHKEVGQGLQVAVSGWVGAHVGGLRCAPASAELLSIFPVSIRRTPCPTPPFPREGG